MTTIRFALLAAFACLCLARTASADDRTVWKHAGGTYEKVGEKKWVEKVGKDTFEMAEKMNSEEQVIISDAKRKLSVILRADVAVVSEVGKGKTEIKGGWVAAKPDKPDPKEVLKPGQQPAEKRLAWKHAKGVFEKTAADKWVETTDTARKVEYAEKAATDEYIELYDAAGKRTVRLSAKSGTAQADGEKAFRPWVDGKWVPGTLPKAPAAEVKLSTRFKEEATLKPEPPQVGFALSPDGKHVARMAGEIGSEQFTVVEVATGKVVQSWAKAGFVFLADWSRDGKTLAGAVRGGLQDAVPQVVVWDTGTWQERARFDLWGLKDAFALSGDGKLLAVNGFSRTVERVAAVWDLTKQKELFTVKVTGDKLPTVALSGDGKVLAVSHTGKNADQVGLYDLPAGKARASFKCGPDFVLSSDASTLVERVSDPKAGSTLKIWTTKSPANSPRTIKEDKWAAESVAFADSGRALVVGVAEVGRDVARPTAVRVYHLKTLEATDTFTVGKPDRDKPGPRVWTSADSSRLVTLSHDRVLRSWTTPFGGGK